MGELDRVHQYTREVIEAVNEIVVPPGWKIMVGMDSRVMLGTIEPRGRAECPWDEAIWMKRVFPSGDHTEWRLSGATKRKPDPLLWHQWWPSLQEFVDAIVAAVNAESPG